MRKGGEERSIAGSISSRGGWVGHGPGMLQPLPPPAASAATTADLTSQASRRFVTGSMPLGQGWYSASLRMRKDGTAGSSLRTGGSAERSSLGWDDCEPKLIHGAAGRLCGVQPRTVEGLGWLRDVRQRWRNNERVFDFATWMEQ